MENCEIHGLSKIHIESSRNLSHQRRECHRHEPDEASRDWESHEAKNAVSDERRLARFCLDVLLSFPLSARSREQRGKLGTNELLQQ